MSVLTGPCRHTAVGGCITNVSDPLHCTYCGSVVNHARTRLAAAISEADPTVLTKVMHELRRPWWRS